MGCRDRQRAIAGGRQQGRGATLFEFAVVASIFALVMALVLDRASTYGRAGDEAAVQALLVQLRSALSGQVLRLQAQGREAEIAGLAGANPIAWLARPPANYVGELTPEQGSSVMAGHWYFDRGHQRLVFVRSQQGQVSDSALGNRYFRVESMRSSLENAEAKPRSSSDAAVALNQVAQ